MKPARFALLATVLLSTLPTTATAQFSAGNIVIYQAGDGSSSLASTGNVVLLREFTTGGTAASTITMPSTGAGAKLVTSGTATSEGMLTLGNNGQTLALAGYNSTIPAGSSLSTTASTDVNRTVALVNGAGTPSFTLLSDFATGSTSSAGNPRGAYTTNGTDIWVAGATGGVRYTTAGSTTSTQLSTTGTNLRTVSVFGGQLYVSTGSGSIRVATVGTGTPTASGQTITNLSGLPSSTGSPYQFAFFRLGNPTFTGPNVLYFADDGAGILKYTTTDGTNWAAAGSVAAGNVRGLTGVATGDSQVTLYATTGSNVAAGGGTLWTVTDNSGTGSLSGSTTTLATAATNTAFRGVAFAPARLEWAGGSGIWDLGAATWKNTAPATPATGQLFHNAYAANFGDIAANATVTIGQGVFPQAVNVTNAANTYTFTSGGGSSGIQGLAALNKSGAGTLVLASGNTYSGGTLITAGTLLANNTTGSATGLGSVTVGGGTLGGTGQIAGAVAVTSGGTLAPGNGTALIGTLTVGSSASAAASVTVAGKYGFNITSTNAGNGTAVSDGSSTVPNGNNRLSVVGNSSSTINLTGATIVLTSTPAFNGTWDPTKYYSWTLATIPAGAAVTGLNSVSFDTSSFAPGASAGQFSLAVNGTNLVLNVAPVPEPTAVLGVAAGSLGLGGALRRARRAPCATGS